MITQEQKNDFLKLYESTDVSQLYLKENCKGDFQVLQLSDDISIKQERLYKQIIDYKTNTIGEIIVCFGNEEILLTELLINI